MTDMAIDLQKPILDFVRGVVIPAERTQLPDFSEKSIDSSFYAEGDDYWTAQKVPPNRMLDFQEGLNFALFKYDKKTMTDVYAGKIESALGIDVPWYLSPDEMKDPVIARKVQAIDRAISILDSLYRDSANRAEYERKMAVGLYAFLLHTSMEDGSFEAALLDPLQKFDLTAFAFVMMGLDKGRLDCTRQLCGLSAIKISGGGKRTEIPLYDILKNNEGECTECSYLYAFAARRAGLNVGFATAATETDGEANHQYNVVYLSDGTSLSVDLAEGKIAANYANTKKIDYYQALANYYRNKSLAAKECGEPKEVVERYHQISLSLNPTDPYAHTHYAVFLYRNLRKAEAYEHFESALRHGGEKSTLIRYNLGITLMRDGKKDEAMPHLQYTYDNLRPILNEYKDDKYRAEGYYMCAMAACILGKLDESLSYFHKVMEINTDRPELIIGYAEALRTRNDSSSLKEAKAIYERLMGMPILDGQSATEAATGYLSVISAMQHGGLLTQAEVDNAYELVSRKQPNNIRNMYNYMVLLQNAGRDEECLKIAERITELPPDGQNADLVAAALGVKADLLLRKDDVAGALAVCEKLIATKPNNAVNHHNYGFCTQQLALKESDPVKRRQMMGLAEEHFNKACQLNSAIDPHCQR